MHKPIVIVGEAFGEKEEQAGRPFVGPSGGVLKGILRQAGVDPVDCHFTNVFNLRPRGNNLDTLCTTDKAEALPNYRPLKLRPNLYVHKKYEPELDRLFAEIAHARPNVVIALGSTALWALCKKHGIKKYRGAPMLSHDTQWKVLPTWHPAAIMRQWNLRIITLADVMKAKREAAFPEIRRPARYIYMEPTLDDIKEFWHKYLEPTPFVSADIETKNKQITEIGFATADAERCIVIPFWDREKPDGNYWETPEQEAVAWSWVRKVCAEKPLIGQNFQYDVQYLWRTVGIPCPHWFGDTMILHHSLQPELEKGLGFLGSVYTDEPSWKFMRQDHGDLKREG